MLPPMCPRPTKPMPVGCRLGRHLMPSLRWCATSSSPSSSFAAATIGSTWSGRRKPTIAPSTAGLRSVQATATAPGVVSWRSATACSRSTSARCSRQLRLLEALAVLAPVVVGQLLDPLAGHRAGQQARAHRRVDDHADPLALGERQELLARPRARPASTAAAASRPARSAGSAGAAATSKFETPMWRTRPCSFSSASVAQPSSISLVRDRPVDLVEVDRVDSEPRQAVLDLAPDRVALAGCARPCAPAPRASAPS